MKAPAARSEYVVVSASTVSFRKPGRQPGTVAQAKDIARAACSLRSSQAMQVPPGVTHQAVSRQIASIGGGRLRLLHAVDGTAWIVAT